GDARAWLEPALASIDLVVVVGGDGAARQVASVIAGRAVHLWISPAGTENLLARALGMERSGAALVRAIQAKRATAIDLGWARPAGGADANFLLMASCGFDADVVARLTASRRGAISHASYLRPILGALWSWRSPTVRLEIDGEQTIAVGGAIVANGPRYAFGIDPVRAARFDDGMLSAALLPSRGGAGALALGAGCVMGFRPRPRACERLRVICDRPVHWQLDGDSAPWGVADTVEFGLRRRAVRILLPAPRVPGQFESSLLEVLVRPAVEWSLAPFDEEV
ncbi:MAG: hypothetical protein FJ253_11315, partial [Phycisphaerae bacterium]|nr:hypothetical protein [Phycisphaerae bacterium]